MSIPRQSYSWYREGKRAPSLSRITRTFSAQTRSGSLHRVCGKARSVFGGNRYEQSAFPAQLHFQWSRSNGNSAFRAPKRSPRESLRGGPSPGNRHRHERVLVKTVMRRLRITDTSLAEEG